MNSKFNVCPVCGKPRGKGQYEFAHGPCSETMAKDGKKSAGLPGALKRITKDQKVTAKRRLNAKKYFSGKLPDWMYS